MPPNSNCKFTDLVYRLIWTDFDRFVTVFSSVRSRTFSLFLFFHQSSPNNFFSQPNGKWFNSRKIKNKKNLSWPFFSKSNSLQNCLLQICDYFALVTSFKLKKPLYRNIGWRWRALYVLYNTPRSKIGKYCSREIVSCRDGMIWTCVQCHIVLVLVLVQRKQK